MTRVTDRWQEMIQRALLTLLMCIGVFSVHNALAASRTSSVIVVATMHGFHKDHPGYNYAQLYALIRDLHPDFVGVEIRPEDMSGETSYLSANYPAEMIALAHEYASRAFGFDWLGDDVAGRPIPTDWWTDHSPIKRLEREQNGDPKYQDTAELKAIGAKQRDILVHATAISLNDGRYDRLTEQHYAEIEHQLANSPYLAISRFYSERDHRLCLNIANVIRANPGKRFVVATGADHRFALVKCLPRTLGHSVALLSIEAGLADSQPRKIVRGN
ncbi:MAG TPA: hypothetical protein VGI90_16230 [Steroidobacteraceae bacterium]|jgi:hypothetical protein